MFWKSVYSYLDDPWEISEIEQIVTLLWGREEVLDGSFVNLQCSIHHGASKGKVLRGKVPEKRE